MFITKKHLNRRTVLRGAGVSVALPLLDAMVPAATALAATAAAPKPRMAFVYFPHGAVMQHWSPVKTGADFELTKILEPVAKHKASMTIVSGLRNRGGESNTPHAIIAGTWLGCVSPEKTHDPHAATTVDQMAARALGADTAFPSLELATEGGAVCDPAYGCSYGHTVAFRSATQPLPMEFNPRKVFLQLFGEGDTDVERQLISRQTTSILDLITDRTNALKAQLGTQDQRVMDNYLETVREIERRLEKAKARDLSKIKLPEAPVGELDNFDQQVGMMFDLVALAYQANLTRVASYIMVAEGTNRTYNFINVPDSFHPLSHHANDRERLRKLTLVQTWHMEQFAKFVDKMANTPDGDGSLLDHSLFMYGSNMSNSDRHNNYPLPLILVGGANGQHKGGKHVMPAEKTPIANLHLTVLNKLGIPQEKFGDSTGLVAGV